MRFQLAGVTLLLLSAAGCGDPGPPTGTVTGKLTIGGAAPPESVLITFVNSTMGTGGSATTGPDGAFELSEPIRVGEYTVYLSKIVDGSGPVSTAAERLTMIPKEYSNETSSPLKKEVAEGENTIDVDVPKK